MGGQLPRTGRRVQPKPLSLVKRGSAMSKAKKQYPELLVELAETLEGLLVEEGIGKEEADEISVEAAERVRTVFAGQLLYIPRGRFFERDERDDAIYRKFDGQNTQQLATEYGLSVQHVYLILKRIRAEMRARAAENEPA